MGKGERAARGETKIRNIYRVFLPPPKLSTSSRHIAFPAIPPCHFLPWRLHSNFKSKRMASMGGGYLDPEPLCRVVKGGGFLNRTLQNICIGEGLSKLGVKAELQQRIIDSTFLPTASPQEATPSI